MADKHIADAEGEFYVANVTPDFCKVGQSVVPFDITQVLVPEKSSYARSVFARGKPVLMQGSVIRAVKGDAGAGVVSNASLGGGDSQIVSGSPTVFVEGKRVARHLDDVLMNGAF